MINIKIKGDWKEVRDTLKKLGDTKGLSWHINEAVKSITQFLINQLKQGMETGKFPHNISPLWAKFKLTHGLDARTLIATGQYINSLNVKNLGNMKWFGGATGTAGHVSLNFGGKRVISLHKLSAYLEEMVPHFYPTYNEETVIKRQEFTQRFIGFLIHKLQQSGVKIRY